MVNSFGGLSMFIYISDGKGRERVIPVFYLYNLSLIGEVRRAISVFNSLGELSRLIHSSLKGKVEIGTIIVFDFLKGFSVVGLSRMVQGGWVISVFNISLVVQVG